MEAQEEKAVKAHKTPKEQRTKRSGSALRENLKRRKAAPRPDVRAQTGENAG